MGARSSNNNKGLNHISDGHLLEYFRNTFIRGGGGTNYVLPPQGLTATGGIISDYTDPGPGAIYRAHIFTSSGTFDVSTIGDYPAEVDYLIVGGGGGAGGGGGGFASGGGGAGGYRTSMPEGPGGGAPSESQYTISVGAYSVLVGGGGAGGKSSNQGIDGSQSALFPAPQSFPHPTYIRSEGGGGGGAGGTNNPGNYGGSGGGSGGHSPDASGAAGLGNRVAGPGPATPSPAPTQGYDGGQGYYPYPATPIAGGGGGGAGGAGIGYPTSTLTHGGVGKSSTIAGPTTQIGAPGPSPGSWFAGGGGGSVYYPQGLLDVGKGGGAGGPYAGGGDGANPGTSPIDSGNGLSGTGGGGGAHDRNPGGTGGSGIVVVRYQIGQLSATAKASGGAISYYGGKTIHAFLGSGTFQTTSAIPSAEVFIVAGGGSGGPGANPGNYASGGGGGAGGVVYHPGLAFPSPATYTITVGGGGVAPRGLSPTSRGTDGTDTTVTHPSGPYVAYRGGAGAAGFPGIASNTGGSSGGAGDSGGVAAPAVQPAANPGATEYGNVGGNGAPPSGGGGGPAYGAGGGGGAGGVGMAGTGSYSVDKSYGHGGIGIQAPPSFRNPMSSVGLGSVGPGGESYWFAGGGGGGIYVGPHYGGVGGVWTGITTVSGGPFAGAGNGGLSIQAGVTTSNGTNAMENTGAGGGGATEANGAPGTYSGGSGGSGIVLIAYPS